MAQSPTLTKTDVINAVLAGLGDQPSANDVTALEQWQAAEGGAGPQFGTANNTAAYNAFNSTLSLPGSSTVVGGPAAAAGVQSYTGWSQGIAATVATLQEPQYAAIAADLAANAPPSQTEADIVNSPWGTKAIGSVTANQSPESANAATSPASASPTSASSGAGSSGAGSLLSDVQGASAGVLGPIFTPITQILLSVALVGGGLGLIVLGLSRMFPGRLPSLGALAAV